MSDSSAPGIMFYVIASGLTRHTATGPDILMVSDTALVTLTD